MGRAKLCRGKEEGKGAHERAMVTIRAEKKGNHLAAKTVAGQECAQTADGMGWRCVFLMGVFWVVMVEWWFVVVLVEAFWTGVVVLLGG